MTICKQLCALAMLTVCVLANVHAGEVPGIASGSVYRLTAKCSGKCLDVSGASAAEGANVQQWTDNGTNAQKWRVDHLGDGYYRLTAACSGKVLDVVPDSQADGGDVRQWSDLGTDNQRWKIVDCGGGAFKLVAKSSGKCLDVNGASSNEGENVQQWTDNGTNAQRWWFNLVDADLEFGAVVTPGEYLVTAKHSFQVLGVAGASLNDAAPVVQQSYDGTGAQRWLFEDAGGGHGRLKAKLSGKVLDVSGASVDNGAGTIQWPGNGGDNQKWLFAQAAGDWLHVSSKHSGKRLDVEGMSSAPGARVIQWEANAGDNQQWKLTACYALSLGAVPVEIAVGYGDLAVVSSQVAGTVTAYESWALPGSQWVLSF